MSLSIITSINTPGNSTKKESLLPPIPTFPIKTTTYAIIVDFIKNIVIAALLAGAGAIYILIILQLTQNTEREKIRFTVSYFSNVARENFNIASSTEGNIQRYIMLGFMILCIILGNAVLIMVLSRFYR